MARARFATLSLAAALILGGGAVAGAEEAGQDVPATEVTPAERPFSKDDVDPNSDAPVAAGLLALPAVLTIGDTTYYLNEDGETYVTDLGRVASEPSAEEAAASRELLAAHSAEVARQAIAEARAGGAAGAGAVPGSGAAGSGAAAGAPVAVVGTAGAGEAPAEVEAAGVSEAPVRGIGAETGSNTFARALFALLLASTAGAAFFAYGRRRLI